MLLAEKVNTIKIFDNFATTQLLLIIKIEKKTELISDLS